MKFWYVVEEKAYCNDTDSGILIGQTISAEIIDVKPRRTECLYEWLDTETVEDNIYTRHKYCRTKAEAKDEIRFFMNH